MFKNIKDSLEISYKQGLESDDNIYIKGKIKDWEEMLSNIKHEQELKDNALKMYDEGQKEIERLNNIINELEKLLNDKVRFYGKYDLPRMAECQIILQKLQQLKEENK
jgi:hypothetical protein